VFEFPAPALLARHLSTELSASGLLAGQPGPGDGPDTAERPAPAGTLAEAYFRAAREGRADQALRLIRGLAEFRPAVTSVSELLSLARPVRIGRGSAPPAMICFPSFFGSRVQEYARFAAGFGGTRDVSVLPSPGFADGEPLASSVDVLAAVHAENIRRLVDGDPFVLAGHSAGGLVAHAVAARLQDVGLAPAGLVLIDVNTPQRPDTDALPEWLSMAPGRALSDAVRQGEAVPDAWLTAMAHYLWRLDWAALEETSIPTLLVRASDSIDAAQPRSSWVFASDLAVRDVPGDHFTMMVDHAATTAQAVDEWLTSVQLERERS
jgi:mycoketide-CoA synthase